MPEDLIIEDAKQPLTENSVYDALKGDDSLLEDVEPEAEEQPDEKESTESEDKDEKIDEDEEEIKDEVTDEEDDVEYKAVPKRQEILKKFPELFKTFPGIEKAIYREAQFTNEFATPADAKHAKERLEVFNKVENDLLSGNIGNLLAAVKQQDPKAFKKIGDELLQTLNAVDRDTLTGIGETINKHILMTAFKAGKDAGDENGEQLQLAAQILHKYLYGTNNITGPNQKNSQAETETPEQKAHKEEVARFNQQRLDIAVKDVDSRVNTAIDKFIEKYIDPKGLMSSYVKDRAMKDVREAFTKEIRSDSRFMQHLDGLWKSSVKNNYSEDSLGAIRKAILGRANSILPDQIRHVRSIVSKSGKPSLKSAKNEENDSEPETKRRTAPPKRESIPSNSGKKLTLSSVMKALDK